MPGAAVAATPGRSNAEPSSNWAGYAASGAQFSKVSGSWTQPTASCDSGSGDAAFWIGIGGASQGSNALEQTGTEVNCDTGTPTYSAWYELVPAAPVTIDMAVNPGDKISSTVGVDGNSVSIHLKNETTGKTLRQDAPDGQPRHLVGRVDRRGSLRVPGRHVGQLPARPARRLRQRRLHEVVRDG